MYTYGHTLSLHDALPIYLPEERTSHGAYLFTLAIMNTAVQILIEHKRCPFRKASILVHYVEQQFPERGFGVQSLIIIGNQFRDSVFVVFGYDIGEQQLLGTIKIGRASCRERVCKKV